MLQLSSIIRRVGFMLLLTLQLSAFSQSYTVITSSGNAYIPLATPNVIDICRDEAISDPIIDNIFMGFAFKFAGLRYETIRVSSNGFLSFVWDGSNLEGLLPAVYIPIADTSLAFRTEPIIAPFWEDLAGDAESKALYSNSSEKFILEWQNWKWKNTRISFQVIFYKSTGIIEFCYKGIPANIDNVKIGIQIPNGDFISPTTPTAVDGQKYQFIPNVIPGNKIQGLHFTIHKTEALEHAPKKYANILVGYPGSNVNNYEPFQRNPLGNGVTNCDDYNWLRYGFERHYYQVNCYWDSIKNFNICETKMQLRSCNFDGNSYPSMISIPIGGRYYSGKTEYLVNRTIDFGYSFQNGLFYSLFSFSYATDKTGKTYKAQMRSGILESGRLLGNMQHTREIFKHEEFGSISIDSENNKWFGGNFTYNTIKYNDNKWVRFNERGIVSIENDGTKWIGDNYNFVEYSSPTLYKSLNDEDFDLGHIATSGLPVTYTSTNSGVATIVDGKVHIVGLGSTTIETNQVGNAEFKPLPTFRQTLIVKEPNVIEIDSITVKTFGDPDFLPVGTTSSGLPIIYKSYDSTIATIVNEKIHIMGVGICNIYANQKGNEIYGVAKTVRKTLMVIKADQTINFGNLSSKTFGDPNFSLTATSNSGLAITFTSSNPNVATVENGTVHIVGAGTCTIYADQAGNANYNAAPQVGRTLTVNKFVPDMSKFVFTSLPDISYQPTICINLNGSIPPSAVLSQPATISYNIQCVKTGGTTTTINASSTICGIQGFVGDVRIYASITITNPNFQNITVGEVDAFVISKANQTITFPSFDPTSYNFANTYGNSDFDIIASVNSGVPITFSSDNTNVATIVNGKIHMVSAGTANITATALGNENYNVATKTQSLTIYKSGQTITFNALPEKTFGDPDFSLTATSTSGLSVAFTSSNPNVATVENGTVHVVGAGTCTITAGQTGDSNYNPATEVGQILTVNKASQTIAFDPLATKTYGDADFALSATSTCGLAVTFTSSNPNVATVENGIVHIIGAGTCSVYANQSGNENYYPASMVSQQLTVAPKSINITATSNSKVYGEADPALTYQFDTNLLNGDNFTGTVSRTAGDNVGTYTIQQGTLSAGNNYNIAFQEANFTISKKNLIVKAENKSKNYGETNPEITLSFDGFAYNDNKAVIDNLPTISCSATQNSISGTYPIELSGGSDNNYNLTLENGTLHVNTILGNVNTTSIQNITSSTVDVYGDLTSHGGEESIIRGFVYGTSANPTILNSNVEVGSGMGAFSQTINGLTPNVKYHIRSYATNSAGTAYGNELFFTTLSTSVPTTEGSGITIYPNPTTGIVNFKVIDPKAKIKIYNLKGELVQMTEPRDNQISIKNLPTGTYIIKIISDDKIKTIKVVKE